MKNLYFLIASFAFYTIAFAQTDLELRVIGGNYEDVASAIVPTPSGGIYALGSTSSHGDGTVRGYIAYFDQEFNYAWSILTPFGSMIENIVDGVIVEGTDDIRILTNRIGENGTYNSTIHYIENQVTSGEIVSTAEIVNEENQTPIALATWQGDAYAFGDSEGDCWLINIDDESAVSSGEYFVWGHPQFNEQIATARVHNDTLYVVGSSIVDGVKQASVWTWGADGSTIWANIGPDEFAYGDNYANDIAPVDGGGTLLYSYLREDMPLGHGILRFESGNGVPQGILDTSGPYPVEGKRLVHHEGELLKLSQIDFNSGTGSDIVIARLGYFGGYINSTVLGTNFNDIAVDFEFSDDGTFWVLGTTYGYLNGSSSICIYRFSSSDLIGVINADDFNLGITNDPMLFQSVGVEEEKLDLVLFPNPASSATRLSKPANWFLYSSRGKLCSQGFGNFIDLSGISDGLYFVKAELSDKTEVLSVRVVN